ncbi:MAG: CDP-diacylglycerol--glycerol-3-phosphate 3-phosphatidyltransferase [Pseudomonadota bacterium]
MKHIPNLLTFARIAILPILILLILNGSEQSVWLAFILYVLASITDFLDGYLARKWNVESAVGKFLDPISDKIFVACVLLALVSTGVISGFWLIAAFIIFIREFLVSGLREFLGPQNISLPVTQLAKWKTTIQMVALGLLILVPVSPPFFEIFSLISLLIAAILTAITGWSYLKSSWQYIVK